jgi:excisionase family DNA binding protein
MSPPDALLDAGEVAELLGVTRRYVWRLARDGELPYVPLGKYRKFDPCDVRSFIEARKVSGRAGHAYLEETPEPKPATAVAAPRRRF